MAKYTVLWGYYQDERHECSTWDEVKAVILEKKAAKVMNLTAIGEGYDADCDGDGFYCCSTGLTEDENEELGQLLT